MEIASLIVGIIGLAALPTVFQMVFGRPRLSFWTEEFTGPDGRILLFALKNEEVKNWLLRLLRVEREARDVQVFFSVQEQGTKKKIVKAASGLLNNVARQEIGVCTEAPPGFTVAATIIGTRDGSADVVEGRSGNGIPIPPGHYDAYVSVHCGARQYNFVEPFQVGHQDYQTIWPRRGHACPIKRGSRRALFRATRR
jgi:hypothetical protein